MLNATLCPYAVFISPVTVNVVEKRKSSAIKRGQRIAVLHDRLTEKQDKASLRDGGLFDLTRAELVVVHLHLGLNYGMMAFHMTAEQAARAKEDALLAQVVEVAKLGVDGQKVVFVVDDEIDVAALQILVQTPLPNARVLGVSDVSGVGFGALVKKYLDVGEI